MLLEKTFADWLPVPFLSLLLEDCILNGKDYNSGGARYNNHIFRVWDLEVSLTC